MTLANKYRPTTWDDVTEQSIIIEILKNMSNQPELANRNFLFVGPAGTGKAQPLYSKILTPAGFTTMGEIKVGDTVITGAGNLAKVSEVYPQGMRPIYEITLQDGAKIQVADNHLNCVWRYNRKLKKREDFVITTTELIKMFEQSGSTTFRVRVDIPSVDFEEKPVPIDPYLLGALLGDGCLSGNFSFSNTENDVLSKVDMLLRMGWESKLQKVPKSQCDYHIVSVYPHKYEFTYHNKQYSAAALAKYLRALGYPKFTPQTLIGIAKGTARNSLKQYPELKDKITVQEYPRSEGRARLIDCLNSLGVLEKSIDKHIPKEYLYNSAEVRWKLLEGLFSTDGYVNKQCDGSTLEYSTSSKQLSEDFEFLVRSLGIRDSIYVRLPRYQYQNETKTSRVANYRHILKCDDEARFCTSMKHQARIMPHQHPTMRNIVDIQYIGEEECQCIMVDHPDHTYISDGFIPTHNTTTARILATELNGDSSNIIEIDAASNNSIDNIRRIVDEARAYPIGSKYKVFIIDEVHVLSAQAWQVLLKTLEESPAQSVFVLCTTNPEKIPETILSRVQVFKLAKISLDGIIARLKHVLDSEIAEGRQVTYTDDAVAFIAKISNGGMRQALTNLDRVLAFSNNVNMENTESALNLPNYDIFFELLNACVRHDNEVITKVVSDVYNSGVNFVTWFEQFQSFIINILKFVYIQDINATSIPNSYVEKLKGYTSQHAVICLRLATILIKMISELKTTTYLQEIAIIYLCNLK